jgi:uncharacterized membrane protein
MGSGKGIGMAEQEAELHLLLAVFDRNTEASQAMYRLKQVAEEGSIEVKATAALQRDPNRKVHVNRMGDPSDDTGNIIGGLLAMMFPSTLLVGNGGVRSARGSRQRYAGPDFSHQDLERAGNDLRPGQSALLVVARDPFVDQISWALQGYTKLDEYRLNTATGAVVAE